MYAIAFFVALLTVAPLAAAAGPEVSPSPVPSATLIFVVPQSGATASAPAAHASPAALPALPEPPPVAVSRIDGAYSLPGGVWNCETLANSLATTLFKLENPSTISERMLLDIPNRKPVELDSLYTYSSKRNRWTVSLQNGMFVGVAAPWSGEKWTFSGTYVQDGQPRTVRLVYTSLGSVAFRIDYELQQEGGWHTFSGATCKRTEP